MLFDDLTNKIAKTYIVLRESNYWYSGANPTVDNVILRDHPQHGTQVLLIQRGQNAVEGGKWAIPGGFRNPHPQQQKGKEWMEDGSEPPHLAALREVGEETGLHLDPETHGHLLQHVGVYEGGGRDPRDTKDSWSRSHAFTIKIPHSAESERVAGADDASSAKWWNLDSLPETLAFDHSKILQDALKVHSDSKGK